MFEGALSQCDDNVIQAEQLRVQFYKKRDSLNERFRSYFAEEIETKKLTFPISYQKNITSAIVFNKLGKDTLVSAENEPVLLFGDLLNNETRYHVNTGEWSSMSSSKQKDNRMDLVNKNRGFEITTSSYIDVKNWEIEVLRRMFWVLLASFGSISMIIMLFTYAFYAVIRQKRNADIKTDFVNNITHELKTPLATLSIATKTLQTNAIQNSKAKFQSTVATIDRQRKRLQKLVDQVVNDSLGFESIHLEKKEMDAKIWLENLLNDYCLQHNNISIVSYFHSESTKLVLDEFQFNTAILNILENATKYGASKICVSTEKSNTEFAIIIEDNGVGIAKNDQAKVFDKFYRIANQTVHNIKGLGLGLYYVDQIVKAHGGYINLKSEVSKGTILIIKIPIE